ncbi:MAG: trypsin-like peptidase domain-containing protein [Candidatus Peregrinibacteria bacterium]|nr:trypsin-like peptidase domain-containing protein [Candidatus Peregrinibacteria bacterium]
MEKKDPILIGAVSGGVTSLIVAIVFTSFVPQMSNGRNSEGFLKSFIGDSAASVGIKGPAGSQEQMVVDAVKKAKPSVVSVIITKDVPVLEKYYTDPFGGGQSGGNDPFGGSNPFGGFGFQIPQYRQNGTEKKEVGGGSGFIVSSDGYIVTNKHVVSDPKAEYTVFIGEDKKKYTAKVVSTDPMNDIAVIKIDATDLPYLDFADSDHLDVGQTAIAIGNPLLEFTNSVSVGVVSGLSRSITAGDGAGQSEQLEGVIQTDAAINPGNSGGPLLNLQGKVIGVNVAVASANNIGFSLPANLVKNAVDSVKKTGKIVRAFIGVRFVQINEKIKEANKLDVDYGVLVAKGKNPEDLAVIPGSPADKAGLVENDIILEVDGKKLDKDLSLGHYVSSKKAGDQIKLKVMSKGQQKEVTVTLEESKS